MNTARTLNTALRLCALAALLLGSGCDQSLHPLYTAGDLRFDPALLGAWTVQDSEGRRQTWTFTRAGATSYRARLTTSDRQTTRCVAHLLAVGGRRFLDLAPVRPDVPYRDGRVPGHVFGRVEVTRASLRVWVLDQGWLDGCLRRDPRALAHERADGDVFLTAAPPELQRFVLAHLHTPGAFVAPGPDLGTLLTRRPRAPGRP